MMGHNGNTSPEEGKPTVIKRKAKGVLEFPDATFKDAHKMGLSNISLWIGEGIMAPLILERLLALSGCWGKQGHLAQQGCHWYKSPWFHLISSYSVLLNAMGYTQKADMEVGGGLGRVLAGEGGGMNEGKMTFV